MERNLSGALRKALNRLRREHLAAVIRYASARLGAMGGVEGGKKRWTGTTKAQRQAAARKAVQARWERFRAKKRKRGVPA